MSKNESTSAVTIHEELNKLASNVKNWSGMAGIPYISEYIEAVKLSEQIAIGILEEQTINYSESFNISF